MYFTPINSRNAVLEAIFTIGLDRPFSPPEMASVRDAHRDLALDLPKLEQTQVSFVGQMLSPGLLADMPAVGPVSMSSFQRDGTLDSRLMVGENLISLNFLAYSSWAEHWDRGNSWLERIVKTLASSGNSAGLPPLHVQTISHHMIDVFKWTGEAAAVGVVDLFSPSVDRLPSAVAVARGQAWSATHAYSAPVTQPAVGQIQDWLGCDLNDEPRFGWRVRVDNMLEFRPTSPPTLEESFKENSGNSLVASAASVLHAQNRRVMTYLLIPEMASRIGLRAST